MNLDRLKNHLQREIEISDVEFENLSSLFKSFKLKKKQFLFRQGEVCRYIAFVNQGCLRYYYIDEGGAEHIIYFAIEEWWLADLKSYFSRQPSIYFLEAIEDCELLLLSIDDFEDACRQIPSWEKFYRAKTQKAYSAVTQKFIDFKMLSAEEKYLDLLKRFPEVFQRVPQYLIASYLGVKPQSLSRIKKNYPKCNLLT